MAENVLHQPLRALLLEPLALDQVAPPGFLALAKASVALLGSSELALRFVPLLSGLAALLLFPGLSRRFQPAWVTLFATGLFAVLPTLIAHGAEFKPYSTDLAAAVALSLIAFGIAEPDAGPRRLLGGALFGAAAVWFSQGAVFMVAGLGGALALLALRDRRRGFPAALAGLLSLWAASAGLAVVSGIHRVPPPMREYLNRFWHPSLPPWHVLAFVLVAAVLLARRDRRAALLLVGPVLATLAAAGAHVYPFSGRAILFLAPAAVLAIGELAFWLVEGLTRLRVPLRTAAVLPALAVIAVIALDPPVYRDEDTRPILEEIARRKQAGDAIYVYYGAERAYRFYAPRVGLSLEEATFGHCHRGDPRGYLRELDRLRGSPRVWVLRAHDSVGEGPWLDGYLARMGERRETLHAYDAGAVLWDLSGSSVLPPDAAGTHPLPAPDPARVARLGCGHGPIGETPPDWK